MGKLVVCGGRQLRGTVRIHGAKNSVLPILAASLMCSDSCTLKNCPNLSDLHDACRILRQLGCTVQLCGDTAVTDTSCARPAPIGPELMGRMRASINFLGASLQRFGRCTLAMPGGCRLGARPIDYHISALQQLGVELEQDGEMLHFIWRKPREGEITLPYPSVGATENVIFAALAVPGTVALHNAAREPEVEDLCVFLRAMGAQIAGDATETLYITGGKPLHGAAHTVMPDRMEAATYLCMTAACGGEITLRKVQPRHLKAVLQVLQQMGCVFFAQENSIILQSSGVLQSAAAVETAVHPGFPTDAQAPLMAAVLRADGITEITESVFADRFQHVHQLKKFGADITLDGKRAIIRGVPKLYGARACATDLRGGAGIVSAALQASGESVLEQTELIGRGYADFTENLRALGAEIYEEAPQSGVK